MLPPIQFNQDCAPCCCFVRLPAHLFSPSDIEPPTNLLSLPAASSMSAITIARAEGLSTSKWSGGCTTQLFLFPPSASYKDRNFDFRISSATVEVEESNFTRLDRYSRKIMILRGETKLFHEGHHTISLGKFDKDAFEGSWKTRSVGQCVDFNLMMKRGSIDGDLGSCVVASGSAKCIKIDPQWEFAFVFVFRGKAAIALGEIEPSEFQELAQGDFASIVLPSSQSSEDAPVLLHVKAGGEESCEVVATFVRRLVA